MAARFGTRAEAGPWGRRGLVVEDPGGALPRLGPPTGG